MPKLSVMSEYLSCMETNLETYMEAHPPGHCHFRTVFSSSLRTAPCIDSVAYTVRNCNVISKFLGSVPSANFSDT